MRRTMLATLLVLAVVGAATLVSHGPNATDYGIWQLSALRNNPHNLVLGWRQYGDDLLLRQRVVVPSRLFGVVVANVSYTPPVWKPRWSTVTAIYAVDEHRNGNGAYANLTAGGVGRRNATVRIKSQRGHGIKFLVEIYGR